MKAVAIGLLGLLSCVLGTQAFAAAQSCPFVYVSNEVSGDLSVVDVSKREEVARISVGKRPRGLKLSPDGRTLYVALSGTPSGGPGVDESKLPPADKSADGIGVVDVATRRLARVIRGISDPEQLAVSGDGARLFVASEDEGVAIMLDVATGRVLARTPVGAEPEGTNITPDGGTVFMTSEAEHRVTALDARTGKALAAIEVGMRPRSTAFTKDGNLAFVADEAASSISVIDASQLRALRTIHIGGTALPMGVAVSPDGTRVYVSTGRGGQVLAIDARRGEILGKVDSGARPWGLAMNVEGTKLFAANGPSNDLALIDAGTMSLIAKVKVGTKPWGAACVPEARSQPRKSVVKN